MKNRPSGCLARQYADRMSCAFCHLRWDVNDPDPPLCQGYGMDLRKGSDPRMVIVYALASVALTCAAFIGWLLYV